MSATRIGTLVTGAAKRIGRAIALDLAANGFDVAVHCWGSRDEAEEVVRQISGLGGRAAVLEADLSDIRASGDLFERATREIGPIRLLVNNASIFEEDSLADFDWEVWDRHFALHLKAPVELSRLMAQALPADEDGLVVNIIDQRVRRLTPRFFSYTLSKSAEWTATQTMAQALAPHVRVNAIAPGPALRNERQREEDFDRQVDALLLGRGPELAEFGRTIRYLWEARSVTGQLIALDGGQHLAWETPDVVVE